MIIMCTAGLIRPTLQTAALIDADVEQTVISKIIGSLGTSIVRLAVKDDGFSPRQSRNPEFLVYFSPAGRERSILPANARGFTTMLRATTDIRAR